MAIVILGDADRGSEEQFGTSSACTRDKERPFFHIDRYL